MSLDEYTTKKSEKNFWRIHGWFAILAGEKEPALNNMTTARS